MKLTENRIFEMPQLTAGSFSGLDRLEIPYDILILKEVLQREDNGNIELKCQAKDGPEEKRGWVHFIIDDRLRKDFLYGWLRKKISQSIETIYNSNFSFENENNKKCLKCGSEMFESMEPKVANLANIDSKFPNQVKYWRCSNENCEYKEKV